MDITKLHNIYMHEMKLNLSPVHQCVQTRSESYGVIV
jgi:hypothetical protein